MHFKWVKNTLFRLHRLRLNKPDFGNNLLRLFLEDSPVKLCWQTQLVFGTATDAEDCHIGDSLASKQLKQY